jgi:Protein of unknown function (DUF3309)
MRLLLVMVLVVLVILCWPSWRYHDRWRDQVPYRGRGWEYGPAGGLGLVLVVVVVLILLGVL